MAAYRSRQRRKNPAPWPGPWGRPSATFAPSLGRSPVVGLGAMQGSAVWRELQLLFSLNLPDTAYYLWEGTATCCHCDEQRLVIGAPTQPSAPQLGQAHLPGVRPPPPADPASPKRRSVGLP